MPPFVDPFGPLGRPFGTLGPPFGPLGSPYGPPEASWDGLGLPSGGPLAVLTLLYAHLGEPLPQWTPLGLPRAPVWLDFTQI